MALDKIIGTSISSVSKLQNVAKGGIASVMGQTLAAPFPNTYSLDLDGVDESLNCGNNFSFTDEITVSAWIKVNTWVNYEGFVTQINSAGSFLLNQDVATTPGSLYFAIYQSDGSWKQIINLGAAPVSDWFHFVGVADGSFVRMYVDGVSVGTPVAYDGTIRTSTDEVWIGGRANGTFMADCLIDEVAIWNGTGLSAAQVLSLYNSGSPTDLSSFEVAPVAWYRNGDSSKALFFNSIWQIPNEIKVDNFSQYSFQLDGIDDYISIYNGASGSGPILFDAGDSFSMSVWVKTSSTAAQNQIISFRGTALIWFYTFVTSGNIRFQMYLRDDSSNTVNISSYNTSSGWITPDAWTNLIFTRNGSTNTMNLYLNGVAAQVPTSDTTSDDFTLYDKLSIGNDNHSGGRYWFDGSMDSVSIWDKELSSGEVTAIYNSGVPTDLSEESNLVGYWRMGEGATWIDLPAPLPDSWSIPDDSTNSNGGTTVGMGIDARINNAPDNTSQANSVNMEEADRVEDTP